MFKINFDALGIAASIACAIHCAMLPLFLTSLPILGINIINNFWFELLMIGLAMFIGMYSLTHGFKKHHQRILPLLIFGAGIILLVLKQFFHLYQLWLLVPAVVLIITAHLINYQACKKGGDCNSDHCKH